MKRGDLPFHLAVGLGAVAVAQYVVQPSVEAADKAPKPPKASLTVVTSAAITIVDPISGNEYPTLGLYRAGSIFELK